MAAKITAPADKIQLAEFRTQGFPAEMSVTIGSGANRLVGTVVASNGFVTSVQVFSPVLGKTIVRSWATRAVKLANR